MTKQLTFALGPPEQCPEVNLGELIDRFIDAHRATREKKTIRSYVDRRRAIETVTIGNRCALELQLLEIDEVVAQTIHDAIQGRGAPSLAARAAEFGKLVWAWGGKRTRQLIPAGRANPFAEVEKARPAPDVPEIRAEIVRALWDATFVVERERGEAVHPHNVHPQTLRFIRGPLLLVGLRPWSEALPMVCSQIYRSGDRWAIRLDKHKTKKKTGVHVLGLGDRAAAVMLEQREAVGGRGKLWPSIGQDQGSGCMGLDTVKRAWRLVVDEASKHVDIDPRLYVYCARHGFATSALEAGATLTEVQAGLRHKHAQTTLRYLHTVPGREGDTADRMAKLVIDGDSSTIDDLAREMGCGASFGEMIEAVRLLKSKLGVFELSQIGEMKMGQKLGTWNHSRFREACARKGIASAADLRQHVDKQRRAKNNYTKMDRRTGHRYWEGERRPERIDDAIELANVTGASLDWLCCRDAYTGASAEAAS